MTRPVRAHHFALPFVRRSGLAIAAGMSLLALAGCSSTNETLTTAATTTPQTTATLSEQRTFGARSQIPAIINGEAITRGQVSRRAAFLKLRRAPKSGTTTARDELIDEVIKMQEARRRGVSIPDDRIEAAYANFAKGNRMSVSQLNGILNKSGVTPDGFKDYIRAQMTWSAIVAQGSGGGGSGTLTEREAVARMLEQGGQKPTATEYLLQQVIFLVPQAERSKAAIAARTREANAMRQRFQSCETTAQFAQGLKNVTVRDLGRKLAPELPDDWRSLIVKTGQGQTTTVRETARGAEFIAVCRSREVSDDRVAQLVFSEQDAKAAGGDPGAALFARLKERAKIEIR